MTTSIGIKFEEDYRRKAVFPDIADKIQSGNLKPNDIYHIKDGMIYFSGLEEGMQSGRPSFLIHIPLPDGKVVLVETSMLQFKMASEIILAKFGGQLD